jgi:CHASE3 domain sensor protein
MSIYARLRILLAVSVLVIGGSVWLIAGQQRDAVIGTQAQLRASSDLLTAMLDQETGLRGYALTVDQAFLEPYRRGVVELERALRTARAGPGRERKTAGLLSDLTSTARQWQANARTAVDQVARRGSNAISITDARDRKALMERFRGQNTALRKHVEERAQDGLQRARWVAFGFVILFSTIVLSLGMITLERQARRDSVRREQRREYVEALQGAQDEREAKELLRRRAERLAPGADAVVFARNASGNSLEASTDAVGAALRHSVRASDFAGRWGGEEFVVLLPDTDHEGAMQAAETIRSLLDGLRVPAVTAHITASLGVATLPDHAEDAPSLIRMANRALYAAKAAGRNCVIAAVAAEQPASEPATGPASGAPRSPAPTPAP